MWYNAGVMNHFIRLVAFAGVSTLSGAAFANTVAVGTVLTSVDSSTIIAAIGIVGALTVGACLAVKAFAYAKAAIVG